MNEKVIYVFEDYNYGVSCASESINYMKAKLRKLYFDEIFPDMVRDCTNISVDDLVDILRNDMRMIEENLEIEDRAYVYGIPVMKEGDNLD